jgi:hypothetical protein
MSFIRHRFTRLMLPGLAIVALLALATSALPASAATVRPGMTATCDTTPVFFGLHGMGEGPSSANPNSKEMLSFDTDQNAISGAVLFAPVTYPDVDASNWPSLFVPGLGAVLIGEHNLQTDIKNYTAGCSNSQDRIALVGYSMGAWVINKWIMDNPLERFMIKAVVLFGDPCWVNGKDKGLVRRSPVAGGVGCMPAPDYPYPVPGGTTANPFPVQSWTMPNDPVTGAGWGGKTFTAQLSAAVNCVKNHCSHLDYTGSTEIYQGAQFVVSQLVG